MEKLVSEISRVFSRLCSCIQQPQTSPEASEALAELSTVLAMPDVDTAKLAHLADLPGKLSLLLDIVHSENDARLALAVVEASSSVCKPPLGHAFQTALRFAAMCQSDAQLECCVSVLNASIATFRSGQVALKRILESGACRVAHRVVMQAASSFAEQQSGGLAAAGHEQPQSESWLFALNVCMQFFEVALGGANGCAEDAAARLAGLGTVPCIASLLEACQVQALHIRGGGAYILDSDGSLELSLLEVLLRLAVASDDGRDAVWEQTAAVSMAASSAVALGEHSSLSDICLSSTACALIGRLVASDKGAAQTLALAHEHWAVQFSMGLDAAVGDLQCSHLDEIAQQKGLAALHSAVAAVDAGMAGLWLPVLLQASAGGVLHQVSRCLHNLDEGIMLAAIKTLHTILWRALSVEASQRSSVCVWQQLSSQGVVAALVACTADYNPKIKAGAFACLNVLARSAAQHWDFQLEGKPLIWFLTEEGALHVAISAVEHWNTGNGDLKSACDGASMLTIFLSTEDQCGLSAMQAVALVADLTHCIVRASQKCWKVAQRERRWRRQHVDVLRTQGDGADSSIQRVRRRSRGYSSSPVSPDRGGVPAGAAAEDAMTDGSSSASSIDKRDEQNSVSGHEVNSLLAAAALALGNCFLLRPELRLHALNCGLLPVLLRLLQGCFCSAMYNCGRRRCLRDEVGFIGGPQAAGSGTTIWQPLVSQDACSAIEADPAWAVAKQTYTPDQWEWMQQRGTETRKIAAASEDRGGMLLSSPGPADADNAVINMLTCLTNLCADCVAAKQLMLVPSLFSLLHATSSSKQQPVQMLSCLLLTHMSFLAGFVHPTAHDASHTGFHANQVRFAVDLLVFGAERVEEARAIWGSTSVQSSRAQMRTQSQGLETTASLETYLHDVTGARVVGLVQPNTAHNAVGTDPMQALQCQAAALSCVLHYILPDSGRLDTALHLGLAQHLLTVLIDHVGRMGLEADETRFQSSHQIVAMCLQAVHCIIERDGPAAISHEVTEPLIAALVQLISNDEDDMAAKRSFVLLQLLEHQAVHHVLQCMMDVCTSLGTRETLPSALIRPLQSACAFLNPTNDMSAVQKGAACNWLEKALVVVNALVFTSAAATTWLTRQAQWHAGLAPLAYVMMSDVGPSEVLSAAVLATNLAMSEPAGISRQAHSMHLVPLISYIFSSITADDSEVSISAARDEVNEARAILLQLSVLLMRGSDSNCAAFVQEGEEGLQAVARLAGGTADTLSEMATEAFLELTEKAAKLSQCAAAGVELAGASRPLLEAFQSGAYLPVLEVIARRANASVDACSARAAQALQGLQQPLRDDCGVPHSARPGGEFTPGSLQ